MGSRRIAPGERLELGQDDPALPGLLAAGVLEPLPEPAAQQPAPAKEEGPGAPANTPAETPNEAAPVLAPAEAEAPAPKKPVRGRQRAG